MFLSLLAASADGFICGFIIGGMGVKFRFSDFLKSFAIIFICCIAAATAGNMLAQTQLQKYIDILGIAVMLCLARSAFRGNIEFKASQTELMALSVATDASAVCLYLAMCGYNIVFISFISAVLHSVLMAAAAVISGKIIKAEWLFCTRYIAGVIFLSMAFVKAINL